MTEIIKPGSVIRRKGHLRIETIYSLRSAASNANYARLYGGIYDYIFKPEIVIRNTVSEYIFRRGGWYGARMKFFSTPTHIYYVDGNCGVWETDIKNCGDIVFNPVCREKGRVVNFRKMEKAEWLFI